MSTTHRTSTDIDNEADLRRAIEEVRRDIGRARSRDELTKHYRHAESLITLTHTPAWQKKFGDRVEDLRHLAESEFSSVARATNKRAAEIGTKADYDESWGGPQHVYGDVNNEADLRKISGEIRDDISKANIREDLTKLFRRAGYLVTLTYSPAWQEKFGAKANELRRLADDEFATTARKINQRATQIGTDADYDETWGGRR
jgi:hypothetical protein